MIRLFLAEVVDRFVRDNFRRLDDYFRKEPFRKGQFAFREVALAADAAEIAAGYPVTRTFAHELGFQPKDIIQTHVTNGATIVWSYASFSRTDLVCSFSADCTVRFYVGRYEENA